MLQLEAESVVNIFIKKSVLIKGDSDKRKQETGQVGYLQNLTSKLRVMLVLLSPQCLIVGVVIVRSTPLLHLFLLTTRCHENRRLLLLLFF